MKSGASFAELGPSVDRSQERNPKSCNVQITRLFLFIVCLFLVGPAGAQALLPVPDVRQSTSYTCGASALQAVLAYWGVEFREDRLVERLGSDPETGTSPKAMVEVAGELGLRAEMREGVSLDELSEFLGKGIPVIVAGQAWRDEETGEWADEWMCGHYMVVIGIDADSVYFEDPSLLGSRGVISRPEFLERWHDMDGAGRKYDRLAIIVEGKRPDPPPPLAPVK